MTSLRRTAAMLGLFLVVVGCDEPSSTGPAPNVAAESAPQPAPPETKAPESAAGQGSQTEQASGNKPGDTFKFIPTQLTSSIGARIPQIDQQTTLGKDLFGQLQPLGKVLMRAGLNWEQVDELWAGSIRSTGDAVACVRTKSRLDFEAVRKALGAEGTPEKVGKALVYKLSDQGGQSNSLAFIDATTLIVGRQNLVADALKNPLAGAVRKGYDTIASTNSYFWMAGDQLFAERQLTGDSVAVFHDFFLPIKANLLKPTGFVIGFARPSGSSNSSAPTAPGATGPNGEPQSSEPAQPGVTLVAGWDFLDERQSTATHTAIQAALRRAERLMAAIKQATSAAQAAPGTPPGSPETDEEESERLSATSGIMLMGEMSQDKSLQLQRTKSALTLSLKFRRIEPGAISGLMAEILLCMGVPAINDGMFEGSLPTLGTAFKEWTVAKPGLRTGVRKIGDMPLRAGYSWLTELLPYVGRDDIYLQFNFEKSWVEKENMSHAFAVVPAFLNPSDPRGQWKGYPFEGMGLTHFVGMSGVEDGRNEVAAALDRTDPRAGIFGYESVLPLEQVTDGTNHTILMIGTGRIAAPWVQGGGATIRGARAPYFDPLTGFSAEGIPSGGTFVLFADGSARAIPANIDPAVFRAMCTAHGAEQIDLTKPLSVSP